jgi:hypothetical protein
MKTIHATRIACDEGEDDERLASVAGQTQIPVGNDKLRQFKSFKTASFRIFPKLRHFDRSIAAFGDAEWRNPCI